MKSATIDNLPLPEDLIWEIFLRLSVKILFLSRCKVVCKQWCAFIESPSFVNQHFCQESNQDRLLLCVGNFLPLPDQEVYNAIVVDDSLGFEDPESDESYELDFYLEGYKCVLSVDETFSEFDEPCHLHLSGAFGELIGPLNGVFWPQGPSALLNTRQFKPLPLVEQVLPDRRGHFDGYLGIGLDPSTGDYKLVLIMYRYFLHWYDENCECLVCVCTSDSDSWRLIENVDSNVPSRRVHYNDSICNTYLNGVYYWPLDFNDTSDVAILAFDMRTEKFKEIQVMSSVARYTPEMLALRGDSLVFLMRDNIDGCSDV